MAPSLSLLALPAEMRWSICKQLIFELSSYLTTDGLLEEPHFKRTPIEIATDRLIDLNAADVKCIYPAAISTVLWQQPDIQNLEILCPMAIP